MKLREEYTCPLELVHDMIKGKWKPIILWRLRLGPTSLAKLERDIEGITQKMLLEQLKELMDYGFVEKKTFEGYPFHVEYFLTEEMGMQKGFYMNELYHAMNGHILDSFTLKGIYKKMKNSLETETVRKGGNNEFNRSSRQKLGNR